MSFVVGYHGRLIPRVLFPFKRRENGILTNYGKLLDIVSRRNRAGESQISELKMIYRNFLISGPRFSDECIVEKDMDQYLFIDVLSAICFSVLRSGSDGYLPCGVDGNINDAVEFIIKMRQDSEIYGIGKRRVCDVLSGGKFSFEGEHFGTYVAKFPGTQITIGREIKGPFHGQGPVYHCLQGQPTFLASAILDDALSDKFIKIEEWPVKQGTSAHFGSSIVRSIESFEWTGFIRQGYLVCLQNELITKNRLFQDQELVANISQQVTAPDLPFPQIVHLFFTAMKQSGDRWTINHEEEVSHLAIPCRIAWLGAKLLLLGHHGDALSIARGVMDLTEAQDITPHDASFLKTIYDTILDLLPLNILVGQRINLITPARGDDFMQVMCEYLQCNLKINAQKVTDAVMLCKGSKFIPAYLGETEIDSYLGFWFRLGARGNLGALASKLDPPSSLSLTVIGTGFDAYPSGNLVFTHLSTVPEVRWSFTKPYTYKVDIQKTLSPENPYESAHPKDPVQLRFQLTLKMCGVVEDFSQHPANIALAAARSQNFDQQVVDPDTHLFAPLQIKVPFEQARISSEVQYLEEAEVSGFEQTRYLPADPVIIPSECADQSELRIQCSTQRQGRWYSSLDLGEKTWHGVDFVVDAFNIGFQIPPQYGMSRRIPTSIEKNRENTLNKFIRLTTFDGPMTGRWCYVAGAAAPTIEGYGLGKLATLLLQAGANVVCVDSVVMTLPILFEERIYGFSLALVVSEGARYRKYVRESEHGTQELHVFWGDVADRSVWDVHTLAEPRKTARILFDSVYLDISTPDDGHYHGRYSCGLGQRSLYQAYSVALTKVSYGSNIFVKIFGLDKWTLPIFEANPVIGTIGKSESFDPNESAEFWIVQFACNPNVGPPFWGYHVACSYYDIPIDGVTLRERLSLGFCRSEMQDPIHRQTLDKLIAKSTAMPGTAAKKYLPWLEKEITQEGVGFLTSTWRERGLALTPPHEANGFVASGHEALELKPFVKLHWRLEEIPRPILSMGFPQICERYYFEGRVPHAFVVTNGLIGIEGSIADSGADIATSSKQNGAKRSRVLFISYRAAPYYSYLYRWAQWFGWELVVLHPRQSS